MSAVQQMFVGSSSAAPGYSIEYLVVAGGGGGGYGPYAGRGGGGGLRAATGYTISLATSYSTTIGAGGTAGPYTGYASAGTKGGNSVFDTITSEGGGYGGGGFADYPGHGNNGGTGGSGGGGGSSYPGYADTTGGVATSGQGYNGGDITPGNAPGGGGGGAGSAATGSTNGAGLSSSITGSAVTYSPGGLGNSYYGGGGGTTGAGGNGIVVLRRNIVETHDMTASTGTWQVKDMTGYRSYSCTATGTITFNTVTRAKWNSADKAAAFTLTNSDLTATNNSATVGKARATLGKSTGKWYWEVTFVSGGTGNTNVGITSSTASLSTYVGADVDSWGIYGSAVRNNGSAGVSITVPAVGDIVGVALDMGAGTLQYYLNGSLNGSATSSITGTMYPVVGNVGGTGNAFTVNFGETAFSYTPPVGYNPGLYT